MRERTSTPAPIPPSPAAPALVSALAELTEALSDPLVCLDANIAFAIEELARLGTQGEIAAALRDARAAGQRIAAALGALRALGGPSLGAGG